MNDEASNWPTWAHFVTSREKELFINPQRVSAVQEGFPASGSKPGETSITVDGMEYVVVGSLDEVMEEIERARSGKGQTKPASPAPPGPGPGTTGGTWRPGV